MNAKSDVQLLRDYAENGSEAAFRELVTRHTDFVFSAALRQVDSPDLTGDIAQGVFADLARKARPLAWKLPAEGSLAGWLHRSTRYAALNQLRDTRRRHSNERLAMEQLLTNSEPAADWLQLRPALDEALDSLDDEDREALLLRYFKNQNLRAVGLALGVGEDAAQKRVSRAVERLREFFAKRGVTVGAGGLAAVISANAVQAAPAGLAANISATAILTGTAASTTTIIAATKAIAMTTLQKTLVTAALTAAIGTGIYEARQAAQLREQNQIFQQEQTPLAEQIQQLQHERDNATSLLAGLRAENARLKSNPNQNELLKLRGEVTQLKFAANDLGDSAAKTWMAKVNKLKQRLGQTPTARIPEFQFLKDQDWFDATKCKLDSEADYRSALAQLRNTAKNDFAPLLSAALKQYLQSNNGSFPSDVSSLQPCFVSQVDDSMLARWAVLSAETIPNMRVGKDWIISEKTPVDDVFDSLIVIGANGFGASDYLAWETRKIMPPLWNAFKAANGGMEVSDPSQLIPYATSPEQLEAIHKLILKKSARL